MNGAVVKKFQDNFDRLFKEIDSINISINSFKSQILEITSRYKDIDSLKSLENKFDSSIKVYQGSHDSIKSQNEVIRSEVDFCKSKIKFQDQELSSHMKRQDDLQQDLMDYRSLQNQKHTNMQDDFFSKIESEKKSVESKFQKLEKELVVSPASVFEQNKDLLRKLESASLDGTNAMLKVNNMDLAIRIIEKKIENLSILIKKIELLAQGNT